MKLTIYRAGDAPDSLAPHNRGARDAWLGKIGPTGYWVMEVCHDLVLEHGIEPGASFTVDEAELADYLGVAPAVLVRTLDRMHRRKLVYFDRDHRTVMSDFRFPDITHHGSRLRIGTPLTVGG